MRHLAAASVWGIGAKEAQEVFDKLQPADKRGEVVRFEEGFTVINDCYNSSPAALDELIRLLAATPGYRRRILATGEMRELGTSSAELHRECGRHAAGLGKIDWMFGVVGNAKEFLSAAVQAGHPEKRAQFFENSDDAAKFVSGFLQPGDILLLKGSRGVKMEKILEAIDAKHARLAAKPAEQPVETSPERPRLMLYYLFFYALRPHLNALNVFRYITVRTAVASLTALFLTLILGPWTVAQLKELQVKQYIREEGPKAHQKKSGTPTMGGILIVASIVLPTLLWADLRSPYVLLAVGATLAFGAIGFIDDYNKVVRKQNQGLTARGKFLLQVLTCVAIGGVLLGLQVKGAYSTQLSVPFLKKLHPDLVVDSWLAHRFIWPLAFIPFVIFLVLVIAGISNGVNLTDGLDGLAIGCVLVCSAALTVLTYVSSNARFADYLEIQKIPDAAELTIFCGSLVGASLGFLWYNAHPAAMFMGDVGSLALGGAIGVVAVIIKQEILLISIGGIFILELLSVIIQVASFKLTGKRVFRMAPLHHHFELIGWSETKVIVRFWILALVFALFSLTTLKLR